MAFSSGGGGGGGGAVLGGGTGTIGQLAKFTTTTEIDDSLLAEGTNLISQKNGTTAQKFYVYGTTANTGEVAQVVALSSANAVRVGSKQLHMAATARPYEFGYEQSDATFYGWGVSTAGHLNVTGSTVNAEIGNTTSPRYITLGSANGTGGVKIKGSTSGTLTLTVPDATTDHTVTLPGAQGAANTLPINNGSGVISWATASVVNGGTGVVATTAYAVLCGGTTSTAALQSVASVGTAGHVLTSNGAAALPTFQAAAGGGAGEWFTLISAVPVTSGKVFSNTHVSGGSGMKYLDGMGVMASLDGDAIWALVFRSPQTLPSGTRKMDLLAVANGSASGNAKVNVKWASAAYDEDWSSLTLNAEGVATVAFSSDDDKPQNVQVTMDADTFVAGEYILVNLTFETSGFTLADVSTWKAAII